MTYAVDTPLVTVVIPTYNRGQLLVDAVQSVVDQTYTNWEVVIADDGSKDDSVDTAAALDPRVKVARLPHTGHIGCVRNAGVDSGTGDLIAFLDSDDLWLPDKLSTQVSAMMSSDARWVYGLYELMDEDGRPIDMRAGAPRAVSGNIAEQVLTTEVGVSISTVLTQRSLFEEAGRFSEDPRLRLRGDHELVIRLAYHADALAIPQVFTRIREHTRRVTSAQANPFERTALVYDLFLDLDPPAHLARIARSIRGRHLADAAGQRLAHGDVAGAARLLARSLTSAPSPRNLARAGVRCLRERRLAGNI